jgi:hypothetical protein
MLCLLCQQLFVYYFMFFGIHYNCPMLLSEFQIIKCDYIVSICILEGTDTIASGIRCYISSPDEVSECLEYQLCVKGSVLPYVY